MQKIVIVGATSGIGKELALHYAKTDAHIAMIGRREKALMETQAIYPDKLCYRICDITDLQAAACCLKELVEELGGMDLFILSSGTGELNHSLEYKIEEPTVLTNVVGFTFLTNWVYGYFETQGYGCLAAISSVGGLRGSGVSPAYNASKAYQMNYLEGLRQKTFQLKLPIIITDIRPGFVDTAMAKGDGLFWVTPAEKAARQIAGAIRRKKKIVYVSKRWWLVAYLLRVIPWCIYKRM